jgi:GntR family transcriptional regulator
VSGRNLGLRDRTPLPQRVYEELHDRILARQYPPGSRLPSEAELASLFGVSRVTVREALKMLQRDALVAARHGRGHFVLSGTTIREPITELRSVSDLLGSLGYAVDTQVVSVRRRPAADVAESLGVAVDEPVVRVERTWSSQGEPLIYSVDTVPVRFLGEGEVDFGGSLVDALALRGFELAYSVARISAAALPPAARRRLGTVGRRPWLLLDQVNFAADDTPLIISHDYHRGDRFEFHVVRRRAR